MHTGPYYVKSLWSWTIELWDRPTRARAPMIWVLQSPSYEGPYGLCALELGPHGKPSFKGPEPQRSEAKGARAGLGPPRAALDIWH